MKIVILDGGSTNPGDLSWAPLEALGELAVYEDTPQKLVVPRSLKAEALIINRISMPKEIFRQLPNLRFVGMLATGYNAVDTKAARTQGVTVCNVPEYCGDSVAQHAFSLLLCLCGDVSQYSRQAHRESWERAAAENAGRPMVELAGKTLGIVGYGGIGRRMAALGLAFGMKPLLYSRTRKEAPPGCRWTDLPTLFSESDVVSLHCPLTPETEGMIDRSLLARMKPTAFLINTSRGGVINSQDLAEALNKGRIAGAGLDVLAKEPPAPDDPLLTAKNCVITPHIAWSSREARGRLIQAVAENLKAFQQGRPQNVVS